VAATRARYRTGSEWPARWPAPPLCAAAIVVLARAGLIGWPDEAAGILPPAAWIIAGYMALNTLGNVTSKSRFERTIFATVTALLAVLSAYVAFS
jgi:hypothetical protein